MKIDCIMTQIFSHFREGLLKIAKFWIYAKTHCSYEPAPCICPSFRTQLWWHCSKNITLTITMDKLNPTFTIRSTNPNKGGHNRLSQPITLYLIWLPRSALNLPSSLPPCSLVICSSNLTLLGTKRRRMTSLQFLFAQHKKIQRGRWCICTG